MSIAAAHADEPSPDAAAEGLPEVIVTARRRDEDAQLVPIAMTTLSGDSFASSGRVRLEELNQSLPSTNIQFSGPRQTSIVVRGIGNNPGNDSLESSVGVYLDNVYLGRASMANLDLVDLEQIAMLRGPQGTLFGKNTTAGVLAIATRPPSFVRGGTLESSVGNYDSYQIKASWSQPLREDELAARLSFARSVRGGFISDVTTGDKLNESDRTGGRAQVLWQPGETFSLRSIVDYSEEHSDAGAFALWNPGPNNGSKYYSAVAAAGASVVYDPDYDVVTLNGCQHYDIRSSGASAEARWNFGGYTFTSISAYRTWRFLPCADPDNTDRDAIRMAGQNVDDNQWTQELRLSSPADRPLSYVLGLYYFNQHQQNLLYTQYGTDVAAITALQLGNAAFAGGRVENAQQLDTDSRAVFAQATWRPNSTWELALGLRETREQKSVRLNRSSDGLPAFEANPNFVPYSSGLLEIEDDALSALFSASYRFSPALFAYVSAARGEKSGAISPTPPGPGLDVRSLFVRPERAKDFEAGVKTSLLDRRLLLNINLFSMRIEDYQATLLVAPSTGDSFQQILSNIGAVRTQGMEADIAATTDAGVTFSLAASYNDAIYLSYPNAPCSAEQLAPDLVPGQKVCDLSSQALVGAPRWILNPGLTYRHRLFTLSGEFQAGYSWHSSYFGTADDSQLARVPSYGILNVRYSIAGQWREHPLTLSFWANNALDRREMIGGVLVAGRLYNYMGTPAVPRTIGLTLRVDL